MTTGGVFDDAFATGVLGLGVGVFELFLALSLWPPVRKCEDTAFAPAAASVASGAIEA